MRFAYWLQCVGVLLLTALAGMSAVTVVIASPKDLTIQAAVQIPQLVPSVNMSLIGRGLETSVVVNPTNPSNMIVTGGQSGQGVARVSSDGGRSWSIANASFAYVDSVVKTGWIFIDPVGTFDADGNAYVGTIDNGTMDWLFKSTDGGNSFLLTSPFLTLGDDLLVYPTGAIVHPCNQGLPPYRDYPAVIADPYPTSPLRNNVYVLVRTGARLNPTTCEFGTAFERSTDGGKTWGSGMWLGPSYFGSDFALSDNRGMAVAPDGTVFLSGLGYCGALGDAAVLKSTNGGGSFQEICPSIPTIGVNSVEVAAVSANTVYVVVYGDNGTGERLYSVVSRDGGRSWSPIARIDDITTPDYVHVANQVNSMWDLSISQQTGRLDVGWLDWRNNRGNYTLADMYYSYSYDGISWAKNIRLTPQGPYYYCTISSPTNCTGTGNDFMWVTSSYSTSGDTAYIVASLGKAACVSSCFSLLTRFVTVTFPPQSLRVSVFYTDSSLSLLPLDNNGNSTVNILLAKGTVESTSPRQVLAWVNVTNIGSIPIESLVLNETLPLDWTINPPWMPAKVGVHVYHGNGTSLTTNQEITRASTITVSQGNPEVVHLTLTDLTATSIGHALMPGGNILLSVRLSYDLIKTSQSPVSYPLGYTDTASVASWTLPYYVGSESSTSTSNSFTALVKMVGDPCEPGDARIVAVSKYMVVQ